MLLKSACCSINFPRYPNPANIIQISTTGNNHEFSLINPPIPVYKNNNLVFNVEDSSLFGFDLKIYHDKEFKNEFVSVGDTANFQVIGVGTVGQFAASAALALGVSVKVFDNSIYRLRRLQRDIGNRVFTSVIQPKFLAKALRRCEEYRWC